MCCLLFHSNISPVCLSVCSWCAVQTPPRLLPGSPEWWHFFRSIHHLFGWRWEPASPGVLRHAHWWRWLDCKWHNGRHSILLRSCWNEGALLNLVVAHAFYVFLFGIQKLGYRSSLSSEPVQNIKISSGLSHQAFFFWCELTFWVLVSQNHL